MAKLRSSNHSLRISPCSGINDSLQGHPTDFFGGISVRKTCNRLKFSVREISSRAFLINAFVFREIKMTFWAQKYRSSRIFGKAIRPKVFGKWTKKP